MGRLYQRHKGGTYYGDYYTPEGKRVQRSLRTTNKTVAKERLRQAELDATPQARGRKQRLSEAIDYMITTMHDKAPGTIEMYQQKGRRIAHTLGDPFVGDITHDMIAGYIAKRLNKEDAEHGQAKPHTVQKELITIRRALKTSHRRELLPFPPSFPEFSAKYKPKETWLEPNEFELMLAQLGRPRKQENKYSAARRSKRKQKRKPTYELATTEERALWASIAALGGASKSEVESLDWADVNLDIKRMKLRGTKRETRERWVPIAPALEQRLRAAGPKASGPVVKPWTSVRHCLHRACARAGLKKRVSPNDLRRTFASWLAQSGVPLLTIAHLMGHSSTRMLEKVYGKLAQRNYDEAIAALPVFTVDPEKKEET
jgi:integrase